jgi:hypothetical protein
MKTALDKALRTFLNKELGRMIGEIGVEGLRSFKYGVHKIRTVILKEGERSKRMDVVEYISYKKIIFRPNKGK